MKNHLALSCLAVLCLCAPSFAGSSIARSDPVDNARGMETRVTMLLKGGSTVNLPSYILAKGGGSSNLAACKAQCRKAYRRCYSQGNQIGKPYVTGGEPCSEQKVMCLRACQQH